MRNLFVTDTLHPTMFRPNVNSVLKIETVFLQEFTEICREEERKGQLGVHIQHGILREWFLSFLPERKNIRQLSKVVVTASQKMLTTENMMYVLGYNSDMTPTSCQGYNEAYSRGVLTIQLYKFHEENYENEPIPYRLTAIR